MNLTKPYHRKLRTKESCMTIAIALVIVNRNLNLNLTGRLFDCYHGYEAKAEAETKAGEETQGW